MKKYLITALTIMIVLSPVWHSSFAEDTRTKKPLFEVPEVKPDFFCGYCHILTYPKVIKKAHASWKTGKHKDVPCVECHYPPEALEGDIPGHQSIPADEQAAKKKMTDMEYMKTELEVLSQLVTILNMDETTVVRGSRIDDRSCTSRVCHGSKKDKFMTKKIKFTKKVIFTHKGHYDKKKWVKGDQMHCSTCHVRSSEKKHFQVSKASCYLCHFANEKVGQGRGDCGLCHKVPTKPLQKQKQEGESEDPDKKPITHKTLKEAKVPCSSCHMQLIQGDGAVAREKCYECHDFSKSLMKKIEDQELMHKTHVADQNAGCFACHAPIEHKKSDFIDVARSMCKTCHPDHHIFQKMLLAGDATQSIQNIPSLMYEVKTNCFGCHVKKSHSKGEKVIVGDAKGCVDCHSKRHKSMLKEWKDKVKDELEAVEEVEKEAEDLIKQLEGKVSKKKLDEAKNNLKQGKDTVNIVRYGNGAHNKKYSIALIDLAFGYFEDILDSLGEEGK